MTQNAKSDRFFPLAEDQACPRATPRRIRSGDLLQGQRRLVIEHGQASYTLLLTRNGKLILTK
jgi:hemin uptake protein HemP